MHVYVCHTWADNGDIEMILVSDVLRAILAILCSRDSTRDSQVNVDVFLNVAFAFERVTVTAELRSHWSFILRLNCKLRTDVNVLPESYFSLFMSLSRY